MTELSQILRSAAAELGRSEKRLLDEARVSLLVEAAHGLAMAGGLDPDVHAVAILESWQRAGSEHWARLFVLCGIKPDADVRDGVMRELGRRAGR
jgi:hypothetical protein